MNTLTLKRFTQFAWGHDNTAPEVWVNPAHVAYCSPRIITRGGYADCVDGTLLYFQAEAGVLAVREPIGLVVSTLQSRGGVCRDCYQLLDEAWRSVCDDCRAHRHAGVDADPEEVAA